MAKLGKWQKVALQTLVRFHGWHPGCGWIMDNHSATRRILDGLVLRGFATVAGGKYAATEAGKIAAKQV